MTGARGSLGQSAGWLRYPIAAGDRLGFLRPTPHAPADDGDILGFAPWEQVQEVAADLLVRVDDLYPERYRVQGFTAGQQLTVLALRPEV